jgi:hypothetical protein
MIGETQFISDMFSSREFGDRKMARLGTKAIKDRAIAIIRANPGGIRYMEIVKQILASDPETSPNTISGSIWDLEKTCPNAVAKPSRGLYLPVNGAIAEGAPSEIPVIESVLSEELFYEPFADFLKTELGEATMAVPIGGAGFQKKWGTPDVVGVYKPLASDRIKFDQEIIAAEIKIDPTQPVVAFGQAVAYRLFAAKCYVVMPKTISEDDKDRLESLCMLFGLGLVLFTPDVKSPDFNIRVRGQRFLPDMFYVNEFADRLCKLDPSAFNQLFG